MMLTPQIQDELFHLRLKARIDSRTTACRVNVTHLPDAIAVFGFTHFPQTDSFVRAAAAEVYGEAFLTYDLRILNNSAPTFAIVHDAFAAIWRNPDSSDPEMLDSQALYGTVVRTYHQESIYTFVQHPDGYVGYLPTTALTSLSTEDYLAWKNHEHAITLVPLKVGEMVLHSGTRLRRFNGQLAAFDGSIIEAEAEQIAVFDPADSGYIEGVLKRATEFMDLPYLWGGKSGGGIDCSGFVQTLALQQGIFLPRDATMQCHVGEIVGYLPDYADLLPGDIMFFMNANAYVFHVGIYLGNHTYLHSAGSTGPIKSSVYPDGENYMSRYGTGFVYARRVHR